MKIREPYIDALREVPKSDEELAKQIGISSRTLYRIKNVPDYKPSQTVRKKIQFFCLLQLRKRDKVVYESCV